MSLSNDIRKYTRTASNIANLIGDRRLNNITDQLSRIGSSVTSISTASAIGVDTLIDNRSKQFFGTESEDVARTPPFVAAGTAPVADTIDSKQNGPVGMKFPPDLDDYYMSMQFMRYQRPAPHVKAREESTMFVTLPLPRELRQDHQIGYDSLNLGMAGTVADLLQMNEAGVDASEGQEMAAGKAVGSAAAGAAAARGVGGPAVSKILGLAALGSVSETITTAAGQLTGAIINPNVGVGFRGPTLRTYQYSWEFAPQNAKESAELKAIIKEIRKRALPSMTYKDSAGILSYPQMVKLSTNPDFTDYKKSMIQNVNVHYSPNGIPAFFKGTREPVFIGLTLSFIEIEYFLSEDFGGEGGQGLNQDLEDVFNTLSQQIGDVIGGGDE